MSRVLKEVMKLIIQMSGRETFQAERTEGKGLKVVKCLGQMVPNFLVSQSSQCLSNFFLQCV